MNYIVMECHEGYAILMDEESRFFHAANLHYSVGQRVSAPILMQQTASDSGAAEKPAAPRIRRIVMRVSAIAACLLLTAGAGLIHYTRNYRTQSVVVLNSDASIKMYLNKEGKVVKLKSGNDAGDALLENYDGLRKNKITVAHELLALQKANGSISDGDTVDVYISAQNADDYAAYKSEFETDISKLKLHVNVQDLDVHPEVTAVNETAAEQITPVKPGEPPKPVKPEEPPKPGADPKLTPPAKPEEPAKPGKEKTEVIQPPQPAEPPKPVDPPAAPADKPGIPAPEDPVGPMPEAPGKDDKTDTEVKPDKPDPGVLKPVKPGEAEEPHPEDDPLRTETEAADPKNNEHPVLPHLQQNADVPEHPVLPVHTDMHETPHEEPHEAPHEEPHDEPHLLPKPELN